MPTTAHHTIPTHLTVTITLHCLAFVLRALSSSRPLLRRLPPFPQVLEKLRVFGVPEICLYIVATGDPGAIDSDTDEALVTSMGDLGALGAGPVATTELVSEGLKGKLGPMQLARMQVQRMHRPSIHAVVALALVSPWSSRCTSAHDLIFSHRPRIPSSPFAPRSPGLLRRRPLPLVEP